MINISLTKDEYEVLMESLGHTMSDLGHTSFADEVEALWLKLEGKKDDGKDHS